MSVNCKFVYFCLCQLTVKYKFVYFCFVFLSCVGFVEFILIAGLVFTETRVWWSEVQSK